MKNYPIYPVDTYEDFRSCLFGIGDKYGSRPAITAYGRKGERETHSYQELARDAEAFGEALFLRGLAGKHIAIAGENSYAWLVAFFGITIAGGVAVLIDIEQSEEILRAMIRRAEVHAVLVSDSVAQALGGDVGLPHIPILPLEGKGEDSFAALCEAGTRQVASGAGWCRTGTLDAEQTAVIAYTSGTTSFAKPVMLSAKGLLSNASGSVSMVQQTEKVFSSLPFYHTYGLTCGILGNLIDGIHLGINGSLKTMARDLTLFRPGTMMAVPLIVEMIRSRLLLAAEQAGETETLSRYMGKRHLFGGAEAEPAPRALAAVKEACFGPLSMIVCGGASLAEQYARELFGFGILVLQGYGITECSPLVSVNRNESFRFDSVGHVLPGVELRFLDGEILVRGSNVMQGYYKDEALTDEAFCEGWFRTGDLGNLDKKGMLYITGRKKNLIVLKNGKKISPEEIEGEVSLLPLVKEVMAYGATNGTAVDDVKLAVMVYPDPALTKGMTPYEILSALQKEIDRVNEGLPAYKQVQMVNLRDNAFQKTATQKIKRQENG